MKMIIFAIIFSGIISLIGSERPVTSRNYMDENHCYNGSKVENLIGISNHLYKCPKSYIRLEAKLKLSEDLSLKCSDTKFSCTSFSNNVTGKHCVQKMFLDSSTFCHTSETFRNLPCYANEYKCPKSGKCLPRERIRNGKVECSTPQIIDESDENTALPSCDHESEFQCNDNSGRCIPREWVQDGFRHCLNGSDESTTLQCNEETEFRCSINGRCVLRNRVNDQIVDCLDATDEYVEDFTCFNETEFYCGKNDRCIPRMWIGNNIHECKSKADEKEMSIDCQNDEFGCSDKSRCLPRKFLCDGNQNCADGSDETVLCDHPRLFTCINDSSIHIPWSATFVTDVAVWSCPDRSHLDTKRLIGFKCHVAYHELGEIKITKQRKLIPQFYLHTNISVCADKSDQCFDSDGNFKCVRCLEGRTIISEAQVCDGFVDCPDLSDECSCERLDVEPLCDKLYPLEESPGPLSTNKSMKINTTLICNGKAEYEDGIDEEFCDKDSSENSTGNQYDDYQCYSTNNQSSVTVVPRDSVCNGSEECPRKDDECSMKCQHNSLGKISMNDLSGRFLETCFGRNLVDSDEMTDCRSLNAFLVLTEKRRYYQANVFISKSKACFHSIDMVCFNNPELCPWRFKCNLNATYNQTIERTKICDLNPDCNDMSDELDCSNHTHFYCLNGEPLFIPREKYKDGEVDCMDRSDEFIDNNFSSKFEMIKNIFLFRFIWFSSTVAMLTNLVVIFVHLGKLSKISDKHKVSYTNTFIVTNLALSDFLMGVALLIVGFKSKQFSGKYSSHDLSWRSSTICNAVQVLTMISSETSVSMLTLLTALRLHTVLKPFKSNRTKYKVWYLAVFLSWLWATFVAFYPSLNERFVKEYFVGRSPFFLDEIIDKNTLNRYYLRTKLMMDSKHIFNQSSFPSRQIDIKGSFGYYSSSSVCFPDLYANTSPEFRLSFVVILYNSAALVFIAVSYILIFKHAVQSKKSSATSQQRTVITTNSKLKTRMMVVVLTDALCWLPIITMAFVSFVGYTLPDIVHPISAIVLIPINSVINPIIYSRFDQILIKLWKRIKHRRQ